MKRFVIIILILLLVPWISVQAANSNYISDLSTVELNELINDIASARRLHYEVNREEENMVLSAVKLEAETYFTNHGIKTTWPWLGFDFHYSKDNFIITLETHLDYKDSDGKNHKPKVQSEFLANGSQFELVFLQVGEQVINNHKSSLSESMLVYTGPHIVNLRTEIDLSQYSLNQMNELEKSVKHEIKENHTTSNSIEKTVHGLVKDLVEDHYKKVELKFLGHGLITLILMIGVATQKQHALVTGTTMVRNRT